ncbi:hypothetical protein OKW24_005033 [Peribacillus simplex]|nr:hypothetical protein [Peribacillus simplex]
MQINIWSNVEGKKEAADIDIDSFFSFSSSLFLSLLMAFLSGLLILNDYFIDYTVILRLYCA